MVVGAWFFREARHYTASQEHVSIEIEKADIPETPMLLTLNPGEN